MRTRYEVPEEARQESILRYVGGHGQGTTWSFSSFWFAYVRDRAEEFAEWRCAHHHRTEETARRCADKRMARITKDYR